jgi:hypothetical protein
MKVRLIANITGTRNGLDWPGYGSVVNLPEDEARAMVLAGSAITEEDDKESSFRRRYGTDLRFDFEKADAELAKSADATSAPADESASTRGASTRK